MTSLTLTSRIVALPDLRSARACTIYNMWQKVVQKNECEYEHLKVSLQGSLPPETDLLILHGTASASLYVKMLLWPQISQYCRLKYFLFASF